MNNQEKAVELWLLNKIKNNKLSLSKILKEFKKDGWNDNLFDSTDMKFLIFRLLREQKAKLNENWELEKMHMDNKNDCIKLYKNFLSQFATSMRADTSSDNLTYEDKISHILYMIDEMSDMDDTEKYNRWLGFIQGVLWSFDFFSVDDFRLHNKQLLITINSNLERTDTDKEK